MIEVRVPWIAFHRAACAVSENSGYPLPIKHEYFLSQYDMIDVRNGPDADFIIQFNSKESATLFLLKYS